MVKSTKNNLNESKKDCYQITVTTVEDVIAIFDELVSYEDAVKLFKQDKHTEIGISGYSEISNVKEYDINGN